jgi:hypothetical protein
MTFPASPTDTQTATVNGITYQYNAARNSWKIVTNTQISTVAQQAFNKANAAFVYTVSASKPYTAKSGDQWYNTTNDVLYEFLNDGTNQIWIDQSSATATAVYTPTITRSQAMIMGIIFGT